MSFQHDARRLDRAGKEDLRRRVVRAVVEQHTTASEAARMFGVARTSVHNWLRLYRRGGDDALVPKRSGRAPGHGRLKGWQAAVVVNIIRDRCPDQMRLPFALWTREAVRDLIKQRFGIHYEVRMVGNLLRRWNFTPQKPVTRAYERNKPQIRRWIQSRYPALHRRAKAEGAEIYWGDETGIRSDHLVGRSWSPRGKTPVVASTGKRFGCNVISAVNNLGKMRFRVFEGTFTQDVMIDFMSRLIRDADRKVILIVDGHPAHKGGRVRKWVKEHKDKMELVLLPGYAPELNPDELLNQDLKSNIFRRRRPATKTELLGQARSHLRSTQLRADIVRSYFEEPHVNYAAAR